MCNKRDKTKPIKIVQVLVDIEHVVTHPCSSSLQKKLPGHIVYWDMHRMTKLKKLTSLSSYYYADWSIRWSQPIRKQVISTSGASPNRFMLRSIFLVVRNEWRNFTPECTQGEKRSAIKKRRLREAKNKEKEERDSNLLIFLGFIQVPECPVSRAKQSQH